MAFADKVTTMRRMVLMSSGGTIWWEGVNIEGTCLLKEVSNITNVAVVSEEDIGEVDQNVNLICVYQDAETEDYWVPREAPAPPDEVEE